MSIPEKFVDIPDDLMNQYRDAFKLFDKNGDGVIDIHEFGDVTKSIGMSQSEEGLKSMIDTIGSKGEVTFSQFLSVMTGKMKNVDTKNEVLRAFKVLDAEHLGKISETDLRHKIRVFYSGMEDADIDALIADAKPDAEGMINYVQFVDKMFEFS